jgi:hypothetical protein
LRHNAALIAPRLSTKGMSDWLWASIDLGEPVDSRFEELLARAPRWRGELKAPDCFEHDGTG